MTDSRVRFPACCLAVWLLLLGLSVAAPSGDTLSNQPPLSTDPLASSFSPHLMTPEEPGGTWLIPQLGNDVVYLMQRPEFYGIFGGLALAPRALHHEDPELNELWAGKEGTADAVFEYGDKMGSAVWPLAAATTVYAIGRFGHHDGARSFGSDLFRAHVINGISTLSYKLAVHRTRPNGAAYSFPSGHTSVMFTTAGVVYAHFGPYWGAAAGLVASYVGLSRLQMNRHYLSDVIGGAIMGGYLGYTIGHRGHDRKQLEVAPMVGDGTVGASLSLKF